MMILVLGANGVTTHRLRFKGVSTKQALIDQFPSDGAAIWEKLRERSASISWLDTLGQITWITEAYENLVWVLRESMNTENP